MGSSFSSTTLSSTTSSSLPTTGNPRKRRRGVDDTISSEQQQPPQSKKRRRSENRSPWEYMSDRVTAWASKAFLVAAEWAAQHVPPGELAKEEELIAALLNVLDQLQGSDLDIMKRGWRILCACSSRDNNDENNSDALPTPASDIATIVATMERNSSCLKIQLLGCRALRTLVVQSEHNWNALCQAGAVPAFLKCIETFPREVCMQGLAITFVAMLIREEGELPRRQAMEQGGIQLILQTMRRFDEDPRLLHTACYALHQLGFMRGPRAIILSNGGLDILLKSVDRHLDDVALVDLCLSALSKISDDQNLAGHDIMPLILKSMKRWPEEASIQGHNLVLILRAVGQEPIPHLTSIQLILQAMKRFPDSASLQFFACAALREILQRTRGRQASEIILSEGGIESILQAVQRHPRIFGLQPMALLVLMHIWEERLPEQAAAATAFGGGDNAIAIVTGLQAEIIIDRGV